MHVLPPGCFSAPAEVSALWLSLVEGALAVRLRHSDSLTRGRCRCLSFAPFHQVLHQGGDVVHLRFKQHRGGAVEMLDLPDLAGRKFQTMAEYIGHQERHVLGPAIPLTLARCIPHAGIRPGDIAPAGASAPAPSGTVVYEPNRVDYGAPATASHNKGVGIPQYAVPGRGRGTVQSSAPRVGLSAAPASTTSVPQYISALPVARQSAAVAGSVVYLNRRVGDGDGERAGLGKQKDTGSSDS